MANSPDEEIDLNFDGVGALVSKLLADAGGENLAADLDYPGNHEAFAAELINLIVALGGSVEVADNAIEDSGVPSANYLIPRSKIHIRLKWLSWRTAVTLVPVIVTIVATGGVLLPVLAGAAPFLLDLKEAITTLTEREKLLVTTVALLEKSSGQPVSAAKIADRIPASERGADVQDELMRLSEADVLEWTEVGFKTRF